MTFEVINTPESTANFVQNRWAYFRDHADELLSYAIGSAFELGPQVAAYTPFVFDINLDVLPEFGTFARPDVPVPPTFTDTTVVVPDAPAIVTPAVPDPGAAPSEPDLTPYSTFSPPGVEPTVVAVPDGMDDIVALDDVVIPTYVEPELPTLDTLFALSVPEAPSINITEFDVARPSFDIDVPDNTFAFTDASYTSSLLTQMQAKLSAMLTGGTGLPIAVENALFEQTRSRDSRAAQRLRTSTADEMAARGLSEPTGLLPRRMLEIEQDVQDKANASSREIFIQRHQKEIDQLNFALQQGAALEGVLIQQQMATNDRRLRAAQVAMEIATSLFNAQVTRFNAEVQAYATDAQVFRDRIQGELAKIELFKGQIDAQRAIGEMNLTMVQAYAARVNAVISLAELFKVRVDAARAQLEVNAQRLEVKRTQVATYSERVRAYSAEWDGYKAQVEARLGSLRAGEMLVGMYGQRVNAYGTKANAAFEGARLLFQGEQLKSEQFKTVLQQVQAQLAVMTAQNETKARSFEAQARVFESEGRMIESEANVKNAVATAKIALAEAKAELQVKNVDAQISQALKLLDVDIAGKQGKSSVLAQLAAAVLSGFNFGASLNASASDSYSQTRNVSIGYSAGGPDISFAIGAI